MLLIFFNFKGLLAAPRSLVFFAVSPFLKLFQAVDGEISGVYGFFLTLKDLNRENAALKKENAVFWEETTRLKEVDRENEDLRRQLGIGQSEERKLIMAGIMGYDPALGQYFLIDKGLRDGLSVGSAVVSDNNFLIGRVAEASWAFSKVLLISDSNFSINVITQDTRIDGVAKGSHGLGAAMEMIPIDAQVTIGETVLTSGLSETIPRGLIIGRIEEVFKRENEIFQRATVALAADINKLERVFVLSF